MLRKGEPTRESILEDILQRVKNLEDTTSRRALPPGYKYIVSAGILYIQRESDGAVVAVL